VSDSNVRSLSFARDLRDGKLDPADLAETPEERTELEALAERYRERKRTEEVKRAKHNDRVRAEYRLRKPRA
jgi:hypothetical protein